MRNPKFWLARRAKRNHEQTCPQNALKMPGMPSMLLLYCYFVPERRLSAVGQEMPEKLEEKARRMTLFSDTRTQSLSGSLIGDRLWLICSGFDLKTSSLFHESSELVSHALLILLSKYCVAQCLPTHTDTHWLRDREIEKGSYDSLGHILLWKLTRASCCSCGSSSCCCVEPRLVLHCLRAELNRKVILHAVQCRNACIVKEDLTVHQAVSARASGGSDSSTYSPQVGWFCGGDFVWNWVGSRDWFGLGGLWKSTLSFPDMQLARPEIQWHLPCQLGGTLQVIGTKGQQIAEIRQKSGAQVRTMKQNGKWKEKEKEYEKKWKNHVASCCFIFLRSLGLASLCEVDVDKSPTGCRVRFVGTQAQAGFGVEIFGTGDSILKFVDHLICWEMKENEQVSLHGPTAYQMPLLAQESWIQGRRCLWVCESLQGFCHSNGAPSSAIPCCCHCLSLVALFDFLCLRTGGVPVPKPFPARCICWQREDLYEHGELTRGAESIAWASTQWRDAACWVEPNLIVLGLAADHHPLRALLELLL